MSSTKKQARREEELRKLEVKKRRSLFQGIASIVVFAILIALKLSLQDMGVQFVTTEAFNLGFFVLAVVFAGIAGIGTRNWVRAKNAIAVLDSGKRK